MRHAPTPPWRRWWPRRPRWLLRTILLGLLLAWYGLHAWLPLHARLVGRWHILRDCPRSLATDTITLAADGTQGRQGMSSQPWYLQTVAGQPVLVLAPEAFHGGSYPIIALTTWIPGVRILTLDCADGGSTARLLQLGIPSCNVLRTPPRNRRSSAEPHLIRRVVRQLRGVV